MLVRLLMKKFGLSEEEKELILAVHDPDLLDGALAEIITVEKKEDVLRVLS